MKVIITLYLITIILYIFIRLFENNLNTKPFTESINKITNLKELCYVLYLLLYLLYVIYVIILLLSFAIALIGILFSIIIGINLNESIINYLIITSWAVLVIISISIAIVISKRTIGKVILSSYKKNPLIIPYKNSLPAFLIFVLLVVLITSIFCVTNYLMLSIIFLLLPISFIILILLTEKKKS